MLAQATTLKEAIAVLEDGMKGTLADYTIASVTETQLMDVFPFDAKDVYKRQDGLLRDLRSLSHPNSLRSDRDAPGARCGLFA